MSETALVGGGLTIVALICALAAQRRFLQSVRHEIHDLADLVGRWAEGEQRRQQQMRDGAAAMEAVITRLREAVARADEVSTDLRQDAGKLEGPIGQLVQEQNLLTAALGVIEHEVREVASTLDRLGRKVPETATEPAGSIEALVLEMIRHRGGPRPGPREATERTTP